MTFNLGYACISNVLREKDVYCSRTVTLAKLAERGIDYAVGLARQNIADLREHIIYNESLGIRFFRISSNLLPHAENPKIDSLIDKANNDLFNEQAIGIQPREVDDEEQMPLPDVYSVATFAGELGGIGDLAKSFGHRLTMHPGQFVQLGSNKPEVVKQSIRDVTYHAELLTSLGYTPTLGSVMILHGGGTYGARGETLERWKQTFLTIPYDIRKFIVLENDEWNYNVLDLLPICEELRIPLCVDFFHHEISNDIAKKQYDLVRVDMERELRLQKDRKNREWAAPQKPTELPAILAMVAKEETDKLEKEVVDKMVRDKLGVSRCPFDIFDRELLDRVIKTWRVRGIRPKFHWSNQEPGNRTGSHGKCVSSIPVNISNACLYYGADLMIEAKDKDICVLKILPQYFTKHISDTGRVEWRWDSARATSTNLNW